MDVERFSRGMKLMQEALAALSGGPFDHALKCLIAAREALLTRYAPFKVGDRVELAVTPKIDAETAYWWQGSKHFLIKGAAGTVRSSDVRSDGRLTFDVEFDDESWIDRDGVRRPVDAKHTYCFGESSLARLKTTNAEVTGRRPAGPVQRTVRPGERRGNL